MKRLSVVMAILALCSVACASLEDARQFFDLSNADANVVAVPAAMPTATPTPIPEDAEREYYRGFFDLCTGIMSLEGLTREQQEAFCNEQVAGAHETGKWYEQESPGFDWER